MLEEAEKAYQDIRSRRAGLYEQKRGLIAVWGREAVQFLDGMITNDMKTLEAGGQMLAAFPNAQGRLLAVVRVLRQRDKFLLETEDATREKLFQNLFRFTYAGDFFVEDWSEEYEYCEIFGQKDDVYNPNVGEKWPGAFAFELPHGASYFLPADLFEKFRSSLSEENDYVTISNELYETLRIESGIPKFGVDMDETTIVPELGLDGLISYNKGCYVGQEIIARIHFRGHVAKQLAGLTSGSEMNVGSELRLDDKNAGRVTSAGFSPKLGKFIALGFVRYDHRTPGTVLSADGTEATVTALPFV